MIRRLIIWVAAVAAVVGLAWAFPLVRIVPLDRARASEGNEHVDAAEYAGTFWEGRLTPAMSRASDARDVLEAIDDDFQAARTRFGRTVGISQSYFVFVRGTGRVVSVDPRGVGLAVRDGADGPDVVLPIGMVFGNAVRDATGLLDMDEFPNSQDYNEIATELNRIVEERVLPALRGRAEVGREVRFVGCAEVPNDARRRRPLRVIPLTVEFPEPGRPG